MRWRPGCAAPAPSSGRAAAPEAPGTASARLRLDRLVLVYRRTRYQAAGVPIRIGRRADAAFDQPAFGQAARGQAARGQPALGQPAFGQVAFRLRRPRSAVLLTAWNPLSRRRTAGWNRRMQHRLAAWLRRYRTLPAEGALHLWHEAHVLVMADPRPMLRLGRRFRQRAVVVLSRGRAARLLLLRYGACSAAAK